MVAFTVSAEGSELQRVRCAEEALANAPGLTIRFSSTYTSRVGPSGHVISVVLLAGDQVTATNDQAVVLVPPGGAPRILLREGDQVAGGPKGARFSRAHPDRVFVDGEGVVAIQGDLDTGERLTKTAVLTGVPGDLKVIAYEGQEYVMNRVPPQTRTLAASVSLQMNRKGEIAHLGWLNAGEFLDDIIIWSGMPAVTNEILHYPTNYSLTVGDPLQRFRVADFDRTFRFNARREILYVGEVWPDAKAGITRANNQGIWLRSEGKIREIARRGFPAPTLPESTYGAFRGSLWNNFSTLTDSGWIAFASSVEGDGVDALNNDCFFAGKAGDIALVAREGHFAPGTGGASFKQLLSLQISDHGLVAFRGQLDPAHPEVTSSNDQGIWVWNNRILKLYLREGDEPPGFPGKQWYDFQQLAVSPTGRLVFVATISGLGGGLTVWATDSTDRPPAFVAGFGSKITLANGTEREVYRAELEKGSTDIFTLDDRFLVSLLLQPQNEQIYCTALADVGAPADPLGSISGRVLDDVDQSGSISPADPGIPDAVVQLFAADAEGNRVGEAVATVRTDANGYYLSRVAPGRYVAAYVSERDPDGMHDGILHGVTVAADKETPGIDFLDPFPPLPLEGVKLSMLRQTSFTGIEEGDHPTGYDVALMKVAGIADLPVGRKSLVIVARAGDELHIRVFDVHGKIVVDKVEAELPESKDTLSLLSWLERDPLPELTPAEKGEIARSVTAIIGSNRTPLTPIREVNDILRLSELSEGLCADGVAPLLIHLRLEGSKARLLRWECLTLTGGEIQGGIEERMLLLDASGLWAEAPHAPNLITTSPGEAGAESHGFLAISPLNPQDLVFSGSDPEIQLSLRVFDADSNKSAATLLIKLRRPPVFLIPSSPSEGWGEDFLNALYASRPREFVQALAYDSLRVVTSKDDGRRFYPLSDVLEALQWDSRIDAFRKQWVMAHPDVIAHGYGGEILLGLCLNEANALAYRSGRNFFRGRFRKAVTIGTPFYEGIGHVAVYAKALEKRLMDTGSSLFPHLPATIKKVPAWDLDLDSLYARKTIVFDITSRPDYDGSAPIHRMASRIDPGSRIYNQIGLNAAARDLLMPLGTDGFVDVETALLGGEHGSVTLLPGFVAHGEDTLLFGDAPKQTHSPVVGRSAIEILDRDRDSVAVSAQFIRRLTTSNDGGLGTPGAAPESFALILKSVDRPTDLPQGQSLVIVALVGTQLHIRIYDAAGKRIVDKTEAELIAGDDLTYLRGLFLRGSLPDVSRLGHSLKRRIIEMAKRIADPSYGEAKILLIKRLVENALRRSVASLRPASVGLARKQGLPESYSVELVEAPGEARSDGPYWFAEVFGTNGVTKVGVTVRPDPANPARVSVSVDSGVVGDVVLYASYGVPGGTVFATPLRVASSAPAGATPQSLTLQPDGITLSPEEAVAPVVWVNYSDGSSVRRWLRSDEFSVSSSAPPVIDVGQTMRWVARSAGEATVTVNYAGLQGQSTLKVVDLYAPSSYAAWKADVFNESELTDPLVSGDASDFDEDGLTTFFEYITGGNPFTPDDRHPPRIEEVDVGDGPRLAFVVRISSRIIDQNIIAQRSRDLNVWSDILHWPLEPPREDPALLLQLDFGPFYELWLDVGDLSQEAQFFRLALKP